MNKSKAVIVDLDGALCNVNHRIQYIRTKPRNWNAWNKALIHDTVNSAVHTVIDSLRQYSILIVTGRSDDYKESTEQWLKTNNVFYDVIYMRKFNDHRDDVVVKGEILDEIEKDYEILMAFDDRVRVVDYYRSRGIWVFDCNQTREDF
jgi:uncharacterized HAD superfamily protein